MSVVKMITRHELRQRAEDPLNLGGLPLARPPADGWPAIEAALLQRDRRSRALRTGGGLLAVAASAVLAFALLLDGGPRVEAPAEAPLATPAVATTAPVAEQAEEPVSAPLAEPSMESLIAMSQQLEKRIRAYRASAGDLPSDVLVYQVELQDLIVQVDDQLSANPESAELWGQRVSLLLDVSRLYENTLRRNYRHLASL